MKSHSLTAIVHAFCIAIFVLGFSSGGFAQSAKQKKADSYFKDLAYFKAAELYEEIIRDGEGNEQTMKNLADSYRKLNEWGKAEQWYRQVIETSIVQPIDYYYLAQSLKANERYEESAKWMQKFADLKKTDTRAQRELKEKTQLAELLTGSANITLGTLSINSENSDFGSAFFEGNKIVFSSSRTGVNPSDYTYAWNNQPFLDLYVADKSVTGELLNPRKFADELNSKYHEGPVTFSQSNKLMYFSRSNYQDKKVGKSSDDVNNLKIYEAMLVGNTWGNLKSMHFNSDEYSCGHPSLNADGTKLYFASDMPGGLGGTDIYVCHKEATGWGKPVNLGPTINTEGNEMFPFIHSDGTLYYSSDGLFGIGGLDIFMAAQAADSVSFETPLNLAKPINSQYDDFAFVISPEKTDGYLSSNRTGGKGDDDIYYFRLDYPADLPIGEPVAMNTFDPIQDATTDSVPVVQSEEEVVPYTGNIDELTPEQITVGQVIRLKNIYYDFDKWNIRPDAEVELKKVIKFLLKYPTVDVELSSHTDCRAPNDYNERLSQRRAISATMYIVTNGNIDLNRIKAQGYGERKLTNECADNVPCSEPKHQLNRRTEIKILKK